MEICRKKPAPMDQMVKKASQELRSLSQGRLGDVIDRKAADAAALVGELSARSCCVDKFPRQANGRGSRRDGNLPEAEYFLAAALEVRRRVGSRPSAHFLNRVVGKEQPSFPRQNDFMVQSSAANPSPRHGDAFIPSPLENRLK
jgi:hypothetical protein